MKGADKNLLSSGADFCGNPFLHFLSGFYGKSHRHDIVRGDFFITYQIGNAVNNDPCLAGARAGENQQGAVSCGYGLILGRVECVFQFHTRSLKWGGDTVNRFFRQLLQ